MNIALGIVYVVLIIIVPYYTYLRVRRTVTFCSTFLGVATAQVASFVVGFCWQYVQILLHASPMPSTKGYSPVSASILAGGFSVAFGSATTLTIAAIHYTYRYYIGNRPARDTST